MVEMVEMEVEATAAVAEEETPLMLAVMVALAVLPVVEEVAAVVAITETLEELVGLEVTRKLKSGFMVRRYYE
jgi:hypothetical protein